MFLIIYHMKNKFVSFVLRNICMDTVHKVILYDTTILNKMNL